MKINIQNLKNGEYFFEFRSDSTGLGLEEHEIFNYDIFIKSKVNKRDKNIVVSTQVGAKVDYLCDSCLTAFTDTIEEQFEVLFTTDRAFADTDEDLVRLIDARTREIDLKTGVRDGLLLSIPMKVTCSENCKGLCSHCGANLNETSCECKHETIDPRWEKLRKLVS
ncbi:DUF177 domain-containing protein [candidate division KSB1 bacterium]|nr:DUF177 domain-containing protein [candidate division KSB1 bacterium]NIR71850.1 DUF177 domain-containing protein [candidate division KSB1 bacterium]NIS25366.1 DUF177 domain-containing protein [candidate division KSB1 bacterium]NIT71836.1 DUF177 domain-containing protein [candidate division KSB1 bacterium]NIU25574.1 DUF177 domain-containing protein [candidate division KSB1 bacterium]